MSENLKTCLGKLIVLSHIKHKNERLRILSTIIDQCLYNAIREIAINAVHGNIKLSPPQKQKLRKHKKIILTLAKPNNTKLNKKLALQSGGFLPILVPAVAAFLGSILK